MTKTKKPTTKKIIMKKNKKSITKKIKKSQKGGSVLGKGGFGCTIDPSVLCSSKSKFNSNNTVSKLMVVKSKDIESINNIIGEYIIGKKLIDNDKRHIHFLGGLSVCELSQNKILSNRDLLKDIKSCDFSKYIQTNTHTFFNMVMPRGYEFLDIFQYLIDNKNLFRIIGHLARGIKIAARKSQVTLLDIKYDNILFTKYSDNFICPVFIDFTAEHVLTKERNLHDYAKDFSSSNVDYYPWPPEIKILLYSGAIVKHNNQYPKKQLKFDIDNVIQKVLSLDYNFYHKLEKKGTVNARKSFYYNVYHYYYGIRRMESQNLLKEFITRKPDILKRTTGYGQLYEDVMDTMTVLRENLNSRPMNPLVSEKIMLCQVGRMFQTLLINYFSNIPLTKVDLNTPTSSPVKTIKELHHIVYEMMHPNINKRPSADDIIRKVAKILKIKNIGFESFLIDINSLSSDIKNQVKKEVGIKVKNPKHLNKYLKTASKKYLK